MRSKNSKYIKVILQAAFVLVVFYFLGRNLIYNWNRLGSELNKINYLFVGVSTMFFALAWILAAISWDYINAHLKNPLGVKTAIKLWVLSQSARYIPGSVWQVVGRVYMAEKKGIKKGKVLASIAIETSNLIISSIIVFIVSLPFWLKTASLKSYLPYFIASAAIFCFLHPKIFNFTTNFFVHRLDKDEKSASYSFVEIIQMLLPYLMVWLLFGAGFYFLIYSFEGVSNINILVTIGMFALSWVIGFLFVIAPGGLGAREAALVYFLSIYFSNPLAIFLAIFSRVLMIIAEFIVILFSFLLR